MDELSAAAAAARLLRALDRVDADTRAELAEAFAALAFAEPGELEALAERVAGTPAAAPVDDGGRPIFVARLPDGTSRRFSSLDALLPTGLNSLMGAERIRLAFTIRQAEQHPGPAFSRPADWEIAIVDREAALAELLGDAEPEPAA